MKKKKNTTTNMPPSPPPQTELNKPKRGRGRPPGAKNRKTKTTRAQLCASGAANATKCALTSTEIEKRTTKEDVEMVATNIPKPMISPTSAIEIGPCENTIIVECQNNSSKDAVIKDCSIESSANIVDLLLGNSQFQDSSLILQTHLGILEQKFADMPPQKVSDAFALLCSVQYLTEIANEPELFKIFNDLLESYRSKQIDTATLSDQIAKYFHAYPDVLAWINSLVQEDTIEKVAPHHEEYSNAEAVFVTTLNTNNGTEESVQTDVDQRQEQLEGITVSWCPEDNQTFSVEQDALTLTTSKEGEFWTPQIATGTVNVRPLQPVDVLEAQSLDDTALLAINLHKTLQARLIKKFHIYEQVSSALAELYEISENLHASTDTQTTIQLSEQRIRAYKVIQDNLKGEPDLLEVLEAFFTSTNSYVGFSSCTTIEEPPSKGMLLSTVEMDVSDLDPEQTASSQLVLPLSGTDSHNGDHPIMETVMIFLPPGLIVSSSKVDESLMFSNALLSTSTEPTFLSNVFQNPSVSVEEKCRRWLQYQCDEKWIDNLLFALDPILMRVTNLRKFITYYLGSVLVRNGSNETENENSQHAGANQNSNSDKEMDTLKCVNPCQIDFDDAEIDGLSSGTYKVHLDASVLPKCSGRTDLCNEVLNDTYYSAVSRRKKFWINLRTNEEVRLDDYEDARYEVDMMLYRNARSIEVFEDLAYDMSKLENIMLERIQLDESLGGPSVIHKHSLQLLYKDEGNLVIDRLQNFPALFIPTVVKNMKVRDREWIEMRARWNLLISSEVKKFMDKCRRQKTQRLKKKTS